MQATGTREGADHRADPRALEGFVRSLVGVREAAVQLSRDGRPATVWVVPSPGANERQVRLNVISALMAGPGLALDASNLRITEALPAPGRVVAPPEPDGAGTAIAPVTSPETPLPVLPAAIAPELSAPPETPEPGRNGTKPAPVEEVSAGSALRLTRFDLEVPAPGRIRVIVGVTAGSRSALGVREGDERPGAAMDLAAHAAADAARSAGAADSAFQLAGVALTEVAGRTHVVAAVDLWTGRDFAAMPGAAAVLASYEEAAARAVLAALSRY
jgi:hypothetical protein